MLYAKEIAELFGLKNSSGNTYNGMGTMINRYISENGIEYEQLYYNTAHGLCKVYPSSIYVPAVKWYLNWKETKFKK